MEFKDFATSVTWLVGVVGGGLSIRVFFHTRQQRMEAWIQQFNSIHDAFWNDPDMAKVRAWIANDMAFDAEIKDILEKRYAQSQPATDKGPVTAKEYESIERLDKFLSLLVRAEHLPTDLTAVNKLRERLFHDYWVKKLRDSAKDERRTTLFWYADEFYPELFPDLHPELFPDRFRRRQWQKIVVWVKQEMVGLWRALAQHHPDAFQPGLAMSLNNLAAILREMDRREEALKAAQEAVDLWRVLVQSHPDAFPGP